MKDSTIKRTLTGIMVLGLALVLVAIYLVVVADIHNVMGMKGVIIITAVTGCGLVLLLPSKIILTLWLMTKKKD